MFRFSLAFVTGLIVGGPVMAGWAESMFEERSKDFGSVPRGPAVTHAFNFTNNTKSTLHINGVRVSCGCTTATAAKTDIAPGQSSYIHASMDTRRFSGHKSVTIYVTFDQPQYEEVNLLVQANGRDDVSFSPDTLNLGRVQQGSTGSAQTTIALFGGEWRLHEPHSETNYIQVEVKEVSRAGGQASYQLVAKLRADAPVGNWYTDVWVATENPSMPRIRVPLNVVVEAPLSVSPGSVALGQVKIGAETERKVIVRGSKPFRITSVKGGEGQLLVTDADKASKPVHVLSVAVKPTKAGEQKWTVRIQTDLPGEGTVEFETQAEVMP